jgi:cyclic beta-1,2-glucan synthetase
MHGRVNHSRTARPESLFRRLGKQHADIRRSDDSIFRSPLASDITKRLRRIYRHLLTSEAIRELQPLASEWFLDNYHVLVDAAAVSHEGLVPDFYERLPDVVNAPRDGTPRVFLLARELLVASELRIDEQMLRSSLSTYQQYAPLTVAEIWALPIMLRLVLLSAGVSSMGKLLPAELSSDYDVLAGCVQPDMDEETTISRVIRALRLIADINWNAFFDSVSRLEAELTQDPAGIYAKMDFRTRDRYRKIVEELAWRTGSAEIDVARDLLTTAARAPSSDERRRHIGYYLIDRGRDEFERVMGFRPRGAERIRRSIRKHATAWYLSCIALAVSAFMVAPLWLLARDEPSHATWLVLAFLALVPAWSLGMGLVQWLVTRIFRPDFLPRIDFSKGITDQARTVVAVPAMLDSIEVTKRLIHDLEVRYLANPDPNLSFVLLTDFADATEREIAQDNVLVKLAETRINALNDRYASAGRNTFYLLNRERQWSEGEKIWKGWERKRGKIVEFNRWILGNGPTSFKWHFGDTRELRGSRFVITLDADTLLPKGAAQALAGIMAHPLNAAEFDPQTKRVVAGYTVVQPRVEIDPASEETSEFTRIVAGDIGIDPYAHAVSDSYQDLFGTGIYVGKGIYDVASFTASLAHTIPPRRVLSHDLLEGVLGRAGLASDISVYEHFPPHYIAYARRLHRWIRGDWQLIPWLSPLIPVSGGRLARNPLRLIDRWKIFENLRRSLFFPLLFAFLVASWLLAPSALIVWTLLGVFAPAAHLLIGVASGLVGGFRRSERRGLWTAVRSLSRTDIERWTLSVAFTCHLAVVAVDAIGRSLTRMFVTRRRLLEWVTFSAASALARADSMRRVIWLEMWISMLTAMAALALIAIVRPTALPYSAPLLLLWIAAPELARWLSVPPKDPEHPTLDQTDQASLRELAFRTWHFFESFVGPNSHWLPPDHFQESPRGEVAQRTSPTNIAMMFLATLVARDMGFIGVANFVRRLRYSLDTLTRMPRYRGHILNWVDTSTLEPLEPRYVSTVDSGNLAGALITLRQACLEMEWQAYLRDAQWQGLGDLLGLLEQAVATLLERAKLESTECVDTIRRVRSLVRHRDRSNLGHVALVAQLKSDTCRQLDDALLEALRQAHGDVTLTDLEEIETWSNDLNDHVDSMHLEAETCFPWLNLLLAPPDTPVSHDTSAQNRAWQALRDIAQSPIRLTRTSDMAAQLRDSLHLWYKAWGVQPPPQVEAWKHAFEAALDTGAAACTSIREGLHEVAGACADELARMDFALLYNQGRSLFHIGYNVSENRLDPHHYDLIASEARLASFIAIARGVAPASHWSQMSRPTARRDGTMVLLSWTGTMFEYLMPPLLMHSNRHTLLSRGCAAAVQQQIRYAGSLGVPWGISESGYYRFDPNLKYQYQAFGVPTLGLKRGLDEHLVIAPYASLLAIGIEPRAVMDNIGRLKALGAVGRFGLYEALDFTSARMRTGRRFQIVRSYMAHHQGMILCALGNYMHSPTLVERFHADPMVRSAEFLLNERVPLTITTPDIQSRPSQPPKPTHLPQPPLQPWTPAGEATVPQLNVLSNGRLATRITNYGGGDLQWSGLSLTRWRPDTTRDHWGYWIYLRDEESHRSWPVTTGPDGDGSEEQRAVFFPHKAEFSRRTDDLFVRTEICVAAGDDIDIRRLEIQNESSRTRRITLTSYAEIVMADPRSDEAHPAFEKLFTQARHHADLGMLEFHRRRRTPEEPLVVLGHRGFSDVAADGRQTYETDRGRFLGRGGDVSRPAALSDDRLSGTLGNTLDPILCVQVPMTLRPFATVAVNFVTGVAQSSERLRESMARYGNDASCRWAFQEAMIENRRELAAIGMDPSMVGDVQRLLSELHYPDGALRSTRPQENGVRAEQPALWPFGISGDYPILLLKLRDADELELLETLLRAHHYWRTRGQHVALVIVNHQASTYGSGAGGRIESMITRCHGQDWLFRHGGIFVINMDQISATDGARLEAAAMAVLDSSHGTLAQQIRQRDYPVHHLPRLVPTLTPLAEQPRSIQVEGLQYENEFGGFSSDGREYIVYVDERRRPPAPWSNVLANPRFGCLTTESGGGYTWFLNAGEFRLTPWSNDPVSDPPGESLYLRDEQTVEVWSPLPLPGQSGGYRIHHGAGYTRYAHDSHQLEQETTLLVPPDDTVKIIRLRLKNRAAHHRRITATYYAEWVLGSRASQTQPHVVTEYDARLQAILASCSWNPDFGPSVAFLASSHETHGFTCDRKEFLGRYGNTGAPVALERVGLASRTGSGMDPCAALQIHLELQPQQEVTCHFVLGAAAESKSASQLCRKYSQAGAVEDAWVRVHDYWDELLGTFVVSTPEPAMDLLLNRWLLYQTLCARIFARTGFYQSSGAYGFRDQLQDVMALLQVRPALARKQILEAAARQFDSGDVLHWWHPPSGKGVRTRCSDDLLWLAYVTGEYVDVTGDVQILQETIPFLSAPPLEAGEEDRYGAFEAGAESATLLEHCRRAVHKGLTTGPNGLPLIGGGDWNDAMNRVGIEGRGESVWLAWFACSTARRFLDLCKAAGETPGDDRVERWVDAVHEAVQQRAWDGAWYRRAFYDDGTAIGSAASVECRIDSISQSWATLSRSPSADRAAQALESTFAHLVNEDERIVALLTPPFDTEEHDPGYIKAYPPGVRENGGQYTHAAVWLAWAVAEQGDGDRAEWLFRLLNPVLRCTDAPAVERYRVEPYVLAADVYSSPEYPGRGGWSWYTGAAAWLWRFGIEGLLGLRRSGGELIFDPCIPSSWPGFNAQIRIDGATTHVQVHNPDARCRGVRALEVGDRMIASNRVALADAAGQHIVVHMGEQAHLST